MRGYAPQFRNRRGKLPPDPRPIRCAGCHGAPRFRESVAVTCACGAKPHPLAYLALLPAEHVLTPAELRRCSEVVAASMSALR